VRILADLIVREDPKKSGRILVGDTIRNRELGRQQLLERGLLIHVQIGKDLTNSEGSHGFYYLPRPFV
jgi:hypothetical protein